MVKRNTEIKPITNEKSRHVCFSKRRPIVIKKAYELSTLCGVHVGAAVFSPAGKPFFFGNPNPEAVTQHLLSSDPSNPNMSDGANDSGDMADRLHELRLKNEELQYLLEVEKNRNKILQRAFNREREEHVLLHWLDNATNALGLNELKEFGNNINIIDGAVHLYRVVKMQTTMPQLEINMASSS